MSPARSWRSASHAAGLHDWFPPKNRGLGLRRRRIRWIQFAQSLLTVTHQPPRRLYPFGARTVRSSRPSNRFLDGFPDPSQFAAAKLTHYSSKPQLPSDSSRSWPRILLPRDVHPNPGPTTKYPCPVCARNVTGRGVSYLYNRCSRWVHSKCSGLQNAAEYR